MSETTKLFWGSALIAAGFGVATLFGPPDYDDAAYYPTVLSYDGVPISGPSQPVEMAGGRVGADVLRLRTDRQPARGTDQRAALPQLAPPQNAHGSVVHPVWEHTQTQPQWLSPVPEVERTSLVLTDDHLAIQQAAAEEPSMAETPLVDVKVTQSPGASAQSPFSSAATGVADREQSSASAASMWAWSDRTTRADLSQSTAGRPAYATHATPNATAPWLNWHSHSAAESSADNGLAGASISRDQELTAQRPDAAPEVHIVVDGDSLPKLAGRYLKDPERAWEIYRLNRDVLASPDLLPIGVVLKLPERGQALEHAEGGALAASPLMTGAENALWNQMESEAPRASLGRSFSALQDASNLEPVRQRATDPLQAPEARLLQPMPIRGVDYSHDPRDGNVLRGSSLVVPANGTTGS